MALWMKNDKIVINSNGNPIDCEEHCPCTEPVPPGPGPGPDPDDPELEIVEKVFTNIVEYIPKNWISEVGRVNNLLNNRTIGDNLNQQTKTQYNNGQRTMFNIETDYIDRTYLFLSNRWYYEFLSPIDNCLIYQTKLDSLVYKILGTAYDNDNYTYLLSSNLTSNNTDYVDFPFNNNLITITIPQQNLIKGNLILQAYHSNIGDITTNKNITSYNYIYLYKYNYNNINITYESQNGDSIRAYKIQNKIWDRKDWYCDDIITGTTHAFATRIGNDDDEYDCGKIYINGLTSSIFLAFNNLTPHTAISSNIVNEYKVHYKMNFPKSRFLNCTCNQLNTGTVLSTSLFIGFEQYIPGNTSAYINNTFTKLAGPYQNEIYSKISGNCNGYVLYEDGEYNYLSSKYTMYRLYFLSDTSNLKFRNDYYISALIGDTLINVKNRSVTYDGTNYKVNNYILSGGTYIIERVSSEFLWEANMTKIPPHTSANINGTVVEINPTENFIDVTNVEQLFYIKKNTEYDLSLVHLPIGTKFYTDTNLKILKLTLLPSCYWNSSLTFLTPYTSGIIDPTNSNTIIELTNEYSRSVSSNGSISLPNNEYVTLTNNSIIIPPKKHYFLKSSQGNIYELLPRSRAYYLDDESANPGWKPCVVSSINGVLNRVNGNIVQPLISGWHLNRSDISCGFENNNWNLYYYNGSWHSRYILTGGTSEQPPPYYYNIQDKKALSIFSGYCFLQAQPARLRKIQYPTLFDSEFGHILIPNNLVYIRLSNENFFDLNQKYKDMIYKNLNLLKCYYMSVSYTSDSSKLWNECGRNMYLTNTDNFTPHINKNKIVTIFDLKFFTCSNTLQKNGANDNCIFKFHINDNENTGNWTGIRCLILTALSINNFNESSLCYYTSNNTQREYGIITANLKLDTFYNIGLTPWNMSTFSNNMLTNFFNEDLSNLTLATTSAAFNNKNLYCDVNSLNLIRPLELLNGNFSSNLTEFEVPDNIVLRMVNEYARSYSV